jgi:short-subunit dehydrogenase
MGQQGHRGLRAGRIDVLVNNAGYSLLGNFEQMTTAEMQQQFATNFYGVVHLIHAVLPVMRQQRSGQIINISSVAGVVGLKHCAAYGATKFAVEGLSLSVAVEVKGWPDLPERTVPPLSLGEIQQRSMSAAEKARFVFL